MSGPPADAPKPSHFLRQIIERDLASGLYAGRRFAGRPGDAALHAAGPLDAAAIRTRFPPEPNGYLHVGHAKSICLNFGLARDYGGLCHLRFDDTNPEKEEQEYVDAIDEAVRWLGFGWEEADPAGGPPRQHRYFASDYFDFMVRAAEALIDSGLAYVDEQSAEQMRAHRGDFTTPGTDSPYRSRTPAENRARFAEMQSGRLPEGAAVLRAKIDMASPNINLRDPALYRIKHATHHNTGDRWCVYPMYTFAHPIEDALEGITHSICTLEFEDQRPFYDWLLDRLVELGLITTPRPHQHEFARLNLSYVVTSKRKLRQLVDEGHVEGWDDPRMPTLVGLRRRGVTPEALRLFCERIGVTKDHAWIEDVALDAALREDLEGRAPRAMAVLDPLKLKLSNWDAVYGPGHLEPCEAPAHPQRPELAPRRFSLGPELWIEREDFAEVPPKGYFRLFPGNKVRLKYGLIVECTGCEKDAEGRITAVTANVVPDTRSGTPGADAVKVKGTITWLGAQAPEAGGGLPAELRLFERLFTEAQPDAGGRDFLTVLNPASRRVQQGYVEPGLAALAPESHLQFERHGYFVSDRQDHALGRPVFNRITGLKDSRGR